jgi:hypothetical protein
VTAQVCGFWVDAAYCGAAPARPYLPGPRCADHTPAAVAGRPEPTPDPASTLAALLARAGRRTIGTPISASQLIDDRAVISGKRRSSPGVYREAVERSRR